MPNVSDASSGGIPWTVQPRQMVISLYGLYAPRDTYWLPVASVVSLLGDLDIDGQSVRSAIYRLKRRGVLIPRQTGGAAGYELSAATAVNVAEGDARIFGHFRASADDGWIIIAFSVPEAEREKRHLLRSSLARRGCGTVAPGLWIAPQHLHDELVTLLQRLELAEYVDIFRADYLGLGDLIDRAQYWWNFDHLRSIYADFIARRSEDRRKVFGQEDVSPLAAFQRYVPMITEWRRLPFADPGLPLEIVGDNWIGIQAHDLFSQLRARYADIARKHALSVIES